MKQALIEGVTMGLVLSAMIGPVFFTLIQNSLENGFRHSVFLALGILLSDLIYVLITFFGVSLLAHHAYFEIVLSVLGGIILMGFGLASLTKKVADRPNTGGVPLPKPQKRKGFFKGFSVNGINPFVLLFWISIAGLLQLREDTEKGEIVIYYAGMLLTVFIIDVLKAYIAKKLKRLVTPKLMNILNRVVGIILIMFGGRLLWFAWGMLG